MIPAVLGEMRVKNRNVEKTIPHYIELQVSESVCGIARAGQPIMPLKDLMQEYSIREAANPIAWLTAFMFLAEFFFYD